MAVKQELEIVITPDGEVVITTRGFKGATCEQAVSGLDRALGKPKKRVRTKEYFEKAAETRQTTRS